MEIHKIKMENNADSFISSLVTGVSLPVPQNSCHRKHGFPSRRFNLFVQYKTQDIWMGKCLAARGIVGESRRLFASGAGNETPQSPTATCCRLARIIKLFLFPLRNLFLFTIIVNILFGN